MDPALQTHISNPYQSMNDVVASLTEVEKYFLDRKDRRAVFVSAYNQVSAGIRDATASPGTFRNPAWVARYGVAFADLYRQALLGFENQQPQAAAWQLSLTESKAGHLLVIQDLILGIHAHVNHDLPWALAGVGIDPDRDAHYADHTKVNDILDGVTNAMQDRIATLYSQGLGMLDRVLGPIDERFSSFSVRMAREVAWRHGVELTDAAAGPARNQVGGIIETETKLLAQLILRPNTQTPWIIDAVRAAEQFLNWTSALRP